MDNVLLNKAANIEKCLQRIQQEYIGFEKEFEFNYTKQDAIVLNLLRACETAIDMANHIIRIKALGLPQSSREVFFLLETAGIISKELSRAMQSMVGFRNIAVHNYTKLDLAIVQSILKNNLQDLMNFSKTILAL